MIGRVAFAALLLVVSTSARADVPPGPHAGASPARPPGEPPAEALALLARHGCVGCHSVDGRAGVGPSFAGAAERLAELADPEGYVRTAIVEPSAALSPGYDDLMPAFTRLSEDELDALVEAVLAIPPAAPEPTASGLIFIASMAAFVLLHFLLSSAFLRDRLVAKLGEGPFQGVYSLAVGAPFTVAMIVWSDVPYVPLWTPPRWASHLLLTLMLPALFLLVAGFSTKSPTSAGMAKLASEPPRGVLTITRHPALVGFVLWGLLHLVANGSLRDLVFFGGMVVLAAGGIAHIEARRRRAAPEAWASFASSTSIVPFLALARGRTRLDRRGLLVRLAVTLVLYAALVLALHRWAFGVHALPPEWGLGY